MRECECAPVLLVTVADLSGGLRGNAAGNAKLMHHVMCMGRVAVPAWCSLCLGPCRLFPVFGCESVIELTRFMMSAL